MADTIIKLSTISWIDISAKNTEEAWSLPANLLLIAVIGYFAVDQLNTLLGTSGRPVPSRQIVLTSAGLVGAGLLIKGISRGFKVNKARIGEKYVLRVWDHSS